MLPISNKPFDPISFMMRQLKAMQQQFRPKAVNIDERVRLQQMRHPIPLQEDRAWPEPSRTPDDYRLIGDPKLNPMSIPWEDPGHARKGPLQQIDTKRLAMLTAGMGAGRQTPGTAGSLPGMLNTPMSEEDILNKMDQGQQSWIDLLMGDIAKVIDKLKSQRLM